MGEVLISDSPPMFFPEDVLDIIWPILKAAGANGLKFLLLVQLKEINPL